MTDYGKVAVLMGGTAAERKISLQSGQAVLKALQNQNIDAIGIDTQTDFIPQLDKIQRVFIALHGRGGEDGRIQGCLDSLNIPYTGTGVLGSALGMDKHRCKQLWTGAGLPTPKAQLLHKDSDWTQISAELGLPLMIKPASEGSSVGMSLVENSQDLEAAYQHAAQYDACVMAETYIKGAEYTAALLNIDNKLHNLPLIKLEAQRKFYDFVAKYEADDTRYLCPCGLDADTEQNLQSLCQQAFNATGATGWGRVDFMIDESGNAWLLEINTVPGMTSHSLVPMAAKAMGLTFDDLVLKILDTSKY